jgi:arylformamidase
MVSDRARSDSVTIHDISLPITESLVVWPGDASPRITQPLHVDRGDPYTVTHLDMCAHSGTHVDAPRHFYRDGQGVDALDLEPLVGPAQVVAALHAEAITAQLLENAAIPQGTERILFRTRNSECWARGDTQFVTDFVAIAEDGARWLAQHNVRLVGVDYLSVGPFENPDTTHRILLEAGIVIVESLDLHAIAPGVYQLVCLPLKIVDADGAPARAILIE